MKQPLIYFVAGEPSGDILAARLMHTLQAKRDDLRFAGIGGEAMQEEGLRSLFPMSDLSVMGIWEVLPRLPLILRRIRETAADIEHQRPDVLVTVDSWGFVEKLLKRLKKHGVHIPVVHYVAPQVWAWKKGRARKVARTVDHLMCLLPYEPPYFEKYGLKCTFVGHPVIENVAELRCDRATVAARYGIPAEATVMAVLPGSRRHEISTLAPIFKQVARRLQHDGAKLYLLLPTVEARVADVQRQFADTGISHRVIVGRRERYEAFKVCDFALAASGTVSLELTACGVPHIIAYRFNRITNWIANRLVTTRFANLINIMADRSIIPEFVLERCRADLIIPTMRELMQQPEVAQRQTEEALRYVEKLKPHDCMPSEKAAEVVLSHIKAL